MAVAVCTQLARVAIRAHLEQSAMHAQSVLSVLIAHSAVLAECTKSMRSTEFPQPMASVECTHYVRMVVGTVSVRTVACA